MTQDNGWDVPSEDERIFHMFNGLEKLLANKQYGDAAAMAKTCSDEFRLRCRADVGDAYSRKPVPPENTRAALTQEEVQKRWAARNPVALMKGQF